MGFFQNLALSLSIQFLMLMDLARGQYYAPYRPDLRHKIANLANLATYRYTTTTRVIQVVQDPDSYWFGKFRIKSNNIKLNPLLTKN
jgi:hypothetical protein